MKLTRSREHVINMGQYESVRVGGSVEMEFLDGAVTDGDLLGEYMQRCHDKLDAMLSQALKHDLDEAISLLPPGSSSYILSWGAGE